MAEALPKPHVVGDHRVIEDLPRKIAKIMINFKNQCKQNKSRFKGVEIYLKKQYCERDRPVPKLIAGGG